ncbi:hypothetical protein [Magnetospirillum sp. XM-1]|uniref:hypothetical protein n=1 Tax=Magnetospirillum sp. XM-1 TaxID=1663591 RepID=UPI000838ADC9|nr:hypothetical protein [Magnetospirillum sp. XM-1]
MVSGVLERLLRETARDGLVRVEDAIKILKLVGRGTYELDVAFDSLEKACRLRFQPGRGKASSRDNPFRRLMVRPFETLLSGEPPAYPRPFLGNYFEVLEAACGDKYAEYDRHSRAILQSLLVVHGHNLVWDTFYAESRAAQVLAHALRRLLRFLDTPPGQWVWVQAMSKPSPTGARPSAEQTDRIRETLQHTLRGFDLGQPATAARQGGGA